MDFSKFDLNLFKVFTKVMETGSYVQASEALDVSPPAVSLAMSRLQKSLQTELFTRSNGKIQPTSAALALYDNVRDELLAFEVVLNSFDAFDPHRSSKQFFISIPEEFHTQFLRQLPTEENKNITYSLCEQIFDETLGITDLRNRKIDLIVDSYLLEDKSLANELLFEDEIVLVVANSHPHSENGINLEDYQTLPQSVLSLRRNNKLALDLFFEKETNIQRHIVNEASSMLANMLVVSETNLFCHTTLSLAKHYKDKLGLAILKPPVALKPIPFYLQWHKANSASPSHQWLREKIKLMISS